MEILRKNFPEIMLDNDEIFFQHFFGMLSSIDELCSVMIVKTGHSYNFRIAPSVPKYFDSLLKEILKFVNLYGIHLTFSKSMKSSSTISFEISVQ